ncbi:MAG: hypothetical protein ACMXX9_03565 [Candidatus Woesearchaeota archaeon]
MRKKEYGSYKIDSCPFCGLQATTKNSQQVPVCLKHKSLLLQDLKCSCGDYLDIKTGKYGVFFTCFNCGAVNFNKGLSINGYPLKSINDL